MQALALIKGHEFQEAYVYTKTHGQPPFFCPLLVRRLAERGDGAVFGLAQGQHGHT